MFYIYFIYVKECDMKYTKKVIKTGGGLVVRIPSDIVKILNLSEKDYVEIDLNKINLKEVNKKS